MNSINSPKFTQTFHLSIFLLTIITAGAHLYLFTQPAEELRIPFLLNGLGFLGLLTVFLMPQLKSFHRNIGWVFLGYTLLTIILWFILGSPREGQLEPFDVMVKAVEITLAIHLFFDSKQESSS